MNYGKIIILNGASSSGKSTLAKKIQELSTDRYYHVQIDTLCNMMHPKFFENKDDFLMSVNSAIKNMNALILNLSKNSEFVIVDTVFENPVWLKDCVETLQDLPVTFVKVDCPLDELERREKARGDRQIGMAKFQYEVMSYIKHYDVEVDTYKNTSDHCAKVILNNLNEHNKNSAFYKIYKENR